jgi:GNAT superfamily N-acetyltransferase
MIEIIAASPNEFSIIQDIAHKTWPQTFAKILSDEQINYMLNMMYSTASIAEQVNQKGHQFILAKDELGYVGYCSYEVNYKEKPDTKIHKIYVLPSLQGKGVGKTLINESVKQALRANNIALILNVNRDNPAIQFYQKFGFEIIDKEDIDIGNGFLMEDYVMKWSFNIDA